MIQIKYVSPAYPPYDLKVGVVYICSKLDNKYIITNGDYKKELNLDLIKSLFEPCGNDTWDKLEGNKSKNIIKNKK